MSVGFVLLLCIFFTVVESQTLSNSFSVTTPGTGQPYTLAFDGGSFFLGYAFGASPLVRIDAQSQNVTVGQQTADVRGLYYFPSTGLLAYASLTSSPTISQIYRVDRYTLDFTSVFGNSSVATYPQRQFFGHINLSPTYIESWKWFQVIEGLPPQNITLRSYDIYGTENSNTTIRYKNTPTVRNDTKMFFSIFNSAFMFYDNQTGITYFYNGGLQSLVDFGVTGTLNTDFVGSTRDGLIWFFDRTVSQWKGFWLDACTPALNPPGSPPSIQCYDSSDPYINSALAAPTMSCPALPTMFAYTTYSDTFSKNCSGNTRLKIVNRTWYANSWVDRTIVTYSQSFSMNMLAPTPTPDSNAQLGPRTLTCNDSTAPGYFPPGNGDYAATITFVCNDGPMLYSDSVVPTCPHNRTIYRTWYYNDFCQGTLNYTQTLTVRDTGYPSISITSPVRTSFDKMDPNFTGRPFVYDDCTLDKTKLVVYHEDIKTKNGSCVDPDEYDRIWTVTDECNLSSTVIQKLIVDFPVFILPDPVVQGECPFDTSPERWGTANSTDPNYKVYYEDIVEYTKQACSASGHLYMTVQRLWTVEDMCGNRSDVQIFQIFDTAAPVLSTVYDQLFDCSDIPDVFPLPASPLFLTVTANDSCVGPVNVTFTDTQDDRIKVNAGLPGYPICSDNKVLNARTTVRTFRTTDTCGNELTQTQTITFRDTVAPFFIDAPFSNITSLIVEKGIQCDATSLAKLIGNLNVNLTWSDNCENSSSVIMTYFKEKLNVPTCNSLDYSWKLTDWCGNYLWENISIAITTPGATPSGADSRFSFSLLVLLLIWIFHLIK